NPHASPPRRPPRPPALVPTPPRRGAAPPAGAGEPHASGCVLSLRRRACPCRVTSRARRRHVMSETTSAPVPDTGLTLRQYYLMVGLGAFVTTIAQPGVIGRLPLRILLKDDLQLSAQSLATFMFVSTFAWNVKAVAGLLSDAFPLFGTRRRHYMIVGAGLAALSWFALGLIPHRYAWLLVLAIAANAFMVMASTVMGGLMVEAGQQEKGSGRITSVL